MLAAAATVVSVGPADVGAAETAMPGQAIDTAAFEPLAPFRIADTRITPCGCTSVDELTIEIDARSHPSVPDDAVAISLTVTAVAADEPAFVTAYPADGDRPLASVLNARTDRNVSNSAIVPLGDDGAFRIFRRAPGDLVVDVAGAFVPADSATAGRYIPIPSTRIVDSRIGEGATGPLAPGGGILVPLPDGVPDDAGALVVNVASVGARTPGNLATRPAGASASTTAFMTVPGTAGVVSNATIVPVAEDGFVLRSTAGGDVVVDAVGWFTGPGAEESSTGLFVPLEPRRLWDTRSDGPRLWPGGTIEVGVDGGVELGDAAAIVTNVAATRVDRRTYVTAYPAGTAAPTIASLNAAFHDHTVANMAITGVSDRGVAYHALAGTDLVVDLTGYFTGESVAATRPPEPNTPPTGSRVLLVGDSTLAGVSYVTDSQRALIGFDGIVDAASCRRLVRPSCRSDVTGLIPNTAVEAITGTPGRLDVVVVKTGYNDWFSDFPAEFDATVEAARAKGAHTIVWMSYNEELRGSDGRVRVRAGQAYRENNADLYRLVERPEYDDVLLADWRAYSLGHPEWFFDGTHTTRAGSYAITDYASRWVAAIEHRPCPRPWTPGGEILDPCPIPDLVGPVADPVALYP